MKQKQRVLVNLPGLYLDWCSDERSGNFRLNAWWIVAVVVLFVWAVCT